MKVGDLIRVLPGDSGSFDGYYDGQLGVIIAQFATELCQHIMMMDGSKIWLQTKRLEVQSESR
jgi:hypothetical protein